MTGAWLVPTVRTSAWHGAAAVAIASVAIGALVRTGDAGDRSMAVGVVLAGAAAAVVSAVVDDPAHSLLAAMPTPVWRRRLRALAVLGPAVVCAWLLAGWSLESAPGPSSVGALSLVGLTLASACARRRPDLGAAVGAAGVLAWALAAAVLDRPGVEVVSRGWIERPGLVAALSVAALVWSARS